MCNYSIKFKLCITNVHLLSVHLCYYVVLCGIFNYYNFKVMFIREHFLVIKQKKQKIVYLKIIISPTCTIYLGSYHDKELHTFFNIKLIHGQLPHIWTMWCPCGGSPCVRCAGNTVAYIFILIITLMDNIGCNYCK